VWRHIAQSVQGSGHVAENKPCQDCCAVRALGAGGDATLVACAADGAGSSRHGGIGAGLACESVLESAGEFLRTFDSFAELEVRHVLAWCDDARRKIGEQAEFSEGGMREFATTLSIAVVSPSRSVFVQIGDGAIVARRNGAFGVVFWPQSGEYVNTTHFLTSADFRERVLTLSCDHPFDDVALITDGLERLALQFDALTPHPPFFQPLFAALRAASDVAALDRDLAQFLQSESLRNKTDDDRTLVLASRIGDARGDVR
jgi:hypothetical protein